MAVIHLQEVEIINMLGCDVVHIHLDPFRSVTMLLAQQDEASTYTPVTTALELILTTKYACDKSLAPLKASFRPGACVRVVLRIGDINDMSDDSGEDSDEPCTSRQAREREDRRRIRKKSNYSRMYTLRTERHFSSKDQQNVIMYTLNDGTIIRMSVNAFFKRFFQTGNYSDATLLCVHKSCNGDWMSLIDINVGASAYKVADGNPFEALAILFKINPDGKSFLLGNLTKKCLEAIDHGMFMNRLVILKIFTHVRSLFEYITCYEYTVWFFIPKCNRFKTLSELVLEDLDFKDVKTYIKLNSDSEGITEAAALGKLQIWSEANHTIKDILLIAFQLALAHACTQPFLILRNLHSFRNYQCLKFATAAFFKKTYKDSDVDWTHHNYIQRVINVAIRLHPTVIIEYPGGVPLKLCDANLVKCEFIAKEGYWFITECNDSDFPYNVNNKNELAEVLEKELN